MIEIRSPLSVPQCLDRLAASVDTPLKMFGGRAAIGHVSGSCFFARKRLPAMTRNSFQPWLTARLSSDGDGTLIKCSFAMNPSVTGFLVFWVSGIVLVGGVLFIQTLGGFATLIPPGGARAGLYFLPLSVLLGPGIAAMGWWLSAGDKDFLLRLVRRAVDREPPVFQFEA